MRTAWWMPVAMVVVLLLALWLYWQGADQSIDWTAFHLLNSQFQGAAGR